MQKNDSQTKPEVLAYAREAFLETDHMLQDIVSRMKASDLPMIQVGEFDGLHLEVLTRGFAVKKAIEIGTLAGYSALCIAKGISEGGRLWTLEVDSSHAKIAKESFRRANMSDLVELIEGPALASLKTLEPEGPFDLVFVDADKMNYPNYYAWAAENLRVGGVLIADNTYGFGCIADQEFESEDLRSSVMALREFNRRMAKGGRFRSTLFPTGEGLTVGVKLR